MTSFRHRWSFLPAHDDADELDRTTSGPDSGAQLTTGTVEFFDGTTSLGTAATVGGVATLSIDTLALGSHAITAEFPGDSSNIGSTSDPVNITVLTGSTVGLAASATEVGEGGEVTFTATVTGDSPTGTVEFFDGTTSLGTAAIVGGVATLTTDSLPVGNRVVTAEFSGDGSNTSATSAPANITVLTGSSVELAVSGTSVVVGDTVVLTATVTGDNPTGTVEFFDGTTSLGTVAIVDGEATLSIDTLALGTHAITAEFPGDSSNTSSTSDPANITVLTGSSVELAVSGTSVVVGDTVVLTATITGDSPTGTVEFFDGTTSLGTAPVVDGEATLSIDTLALGTHAITAEFAGDSSNTGATSDPASITVLTGSTVGLAVSGTSVVVGDTVVLTATVTGDSPAGTVEFFDGTTSLGTVAIVDGEATLSIDTLALGVHAITAEFPGDSSNTSATSDPANITVLADSAIGLAASATEIGQGEEVTFTATITGDNPTGTVEFFASDVDSGLPLVDNGAALSTSATSPGTAPVPLVDNGAALSTSATSLGTAPVVDGEATLTINSLPVGNNVVTAEFSADGLSSASTSAPVTVAVLTNSTVELAVSGTSIIAGDALVLTATITGDNPTGTVEFFDGTTSLGTAALVDGVATLEIASLTVGDHAITASFPGNSGNTSGLSPSTTVTVSPAPSAETAETTPEAGGTVTVSGSDFAPNSTVEVWLTTPNSVLLGTFTADETGRVLGIVQLPAGVEGTASISLVGTDVAGKQATAVRAFDIASATTGTLAFTGINSFSLVASALLLLGLGFGFRLVGGRRRSTT